MVSPVVSPPLQVLRRIFKELKVLSRFKVKAGLNSRIPGHLLASHWIRIATIVIYLVLQSPPTRVNKVAGYSEVLNAYWRVGQRSNSRSLLWNTVTVFHFLSEALNKVIYKIIKVNSSVNRLKWSIDSERKSRPMITSPQSLCKHCFYWEEWR